MIVITADNWYYTKGINDLCYTKYAIDGRRRVSYSITIELQITIVDFFHDCGFQFSTHTNS